LKETFSENLKAGYLLDYFAAATNSGETSMPLRRNIRIMALNKTLLIFPDLTALICDENKIPMLDRTNATHYKSSSF
jgi:hypothetical protein